MRRWTGAHVTNLRRRVALTLPRVCTRCPDLVQPTDEWDLDHIVAQAEGGQRWDLRNLGPAHARCNRSHGAHLGNQLKRDAKKRVRSWIS